MLPAALILFVVMFHISVVVFFLFAVLFLFGSSVFLIVVVLRDLLLFSFLQLYYPLCGCVL